MANVRARYDKHGKAISYQIRVFKGRDELGNQLKPYVRTWRVPEGLTEKQIQKKLNEIVTLFENECKHGYTTDNRQSFAEYARYALDLKARNGIKHRTLVRYNELLLRINTEFGHIKLRDIKPQHLNDFYKKLNCHGEKKSLGKATPKVDVSAILASSNLTRATLAAKASVAPNTITVITQGRTVSLASAEKVAIALGMDVKKLFYVTSEVAKLSSKTIVEHHRQISTIFRQAEKEMLIPYNPASKASPPRVEKKEANYFSEDDIVRIRECLKTESLKWQLAISLLLITGCRRGEILGLKWDRIDWENNQIHICNNLLYTHDRGVYEDTTKTTQSNRYIKIPQEAISMLHAYRKECQHKANTLRLVFNEVGFVFTQDNGLPMSPDSLTGFCSKFSKRHGLPHINPHAFRHTHISLLILNGIDVITTSRRAGHSDIATTMNTYGHIIKKADERASECIADVIFGNKKSAQGN